MEKIPCFVLIFFNFDHVVETLEFLCKKSDKLDIYVIENPSSYTDSKIKPYLLELLRAKKITKYFLMDDNILVNAFEVIFKSNTPLWGTHPYILFTEGDVSCPTDTWLEEKITVLEENPHIGLVGSNLSKHNLPLKSFPASANWVPRPISEYPKYNIEHQTGLQVILIRNTVLSRFIAFMEKKKINFGDTGLHVFLRTIPNAAWASSKPSEITHLAWSLYQDLDNEYTKLREDVPEKTFRICNKLSGYIEYTISGEMFSETHVKYATEKEVVHPNSNLDAVPPKKFKTPADKHSISARANRIFVQPNRSSRIKNGE